MSSEDRFYRTPVLQRVWQHEASSSTHKLLLLALAEHADSLGMCCPAPERLAAMISKELRHTRQTLKELVACGDLLRRRGGGRGNVTIYAIAVGLDEQAREDLNSALQRTVFRSGKLERGDLHNGANSAEGRTVSEPINSALENSVEENSVFQRQETVHSTDLDAAQNEASERAKVPENESANHGINHVGGVGVTRTGKKAARAERPIPRHVAYLAEKGMGAAKEFESFDPDAAIADFERRRAQGIPVGTIVQQWRLIVRAGGKLGEVTGNERSENTAADQHERSANPQRGSSSKPARPGEAGYYKRK